jgi:hypothetical protein
MLTFININIYFFNPQFLGIKEETNKPRNSHPISYIACEQTPVIQPSIEPISQEYLSYTYQVYQDSPRDVS